MLTIHPRGVACFRVSAAAACFHVALPLENKYASFCPQRLPASETKILVCCGATNSNSKFGQPEPHACGGPAEIGVRVGRVTHLGDVQNASSFQAPLGWAVHLKHVKPFYCAIMACDAGRLIAVSGGNGEEAVVKEAALPEGGRMWPELKGEGVYDAHSKDGYRTQVTDTLWSLSKS
ncbi:hypothetical protein BHM03_00024504 [Ensete ventricosum]|nr:hypothetical protein BHM03_00024504 [Ensete ventricosum]